MDFTIIRSQRGINLLELILAVALCGMALLAVIGVQWRYHKAMQKDEVRFQARAVATSLLNEVETALRTDFDSSYAVPLTDCPAQLDPEGTFQYQILEAFDDAEGNLKKIDVEIHWESEQGPRKEVLWCVFLRGE